MTTCEHLRIVRIEPEFDNEPRYRCYCGATGSSDQFTEGRTDGPGYLEYYRPTRERSQRRYRRGLRCLGVGHTDRRPDSPRLPDTRLPAHARLAPNDQRSGLRGPPGRGFPPDRRGLKSPSPARCTLWGMIDDTERPGEAVRPPALDAPGLRLLPDDEE